MTVDFNTGCHVLPPSVEPSTPNADISTCFESFGWTAYSITITLPRLSLYAVFVHVVAFALSYAPVSMSPPTKPLPVAAIAQGGIPSFADTSLNDLAPSVEP